jgi:two-component system sensor histidine kinase KdpD
MIRKTLEADGCEILTEYAVSQENPADVSDDHGLAREEFRLPTGDSLVRWVAANSKCVVERLDGTMRIANHRGSSLGSSELQLDAVRAVLVPLAVADRTVGVLRLVRAAGLELDPARVRFVDAIAYYAALGVERVRLESEAEHADALRERDTLKNAMLASVSHDLRTPLTTIKGLAHDIRLEGDERAATIEEEADRLNRLVADLLDLSRIAGKALQLVPEINAVEDLLGAALQRVAGTLNGRTVQVQLDTTQPLLLGRFDFTHSLRIVVNLLENSIKFSPDESVIDVTADSADDAVEIVVADRGGGVPAAEADRIFEPFYRSALSSAGMTGSGLGLSIAKDLAEAQGGTLRYEPRAGGGSRFLLTLPGARLDETVVSGSVAAGN